MRAFSDIPIRQKLTAIIMITCCTALFLGTALFISHELLSFRRALIEKIDTLAKLTGNNIVAPLTFLDKRSADETLKALRAEPHIVSACVFDHDVQLFASYQKDNALPAVTSGGSDPCTRLQNPSGATNQEQFVNNRIVVSRTITFEKDLLGVIYINSDLGEIRARLLWYLAIAGLVMMLSLLIAYLLSV